MATPHRILLIDDNPIFLRHAKRFIERHPRVRVEATAQRVTEGIEKAEAVRPDVILLDLSMPERSGLDALPDLRSAVPEARIIMVTLHEGEPYRQRALQRGADGFVNKRSLADELLDVIFPGEPDSEAPSPSIE